MSHEFDDGSPKTNSKTVAVTGLNAVDSPGPGVPVLRSLQESSLELALIGLAYDVLDPGNFMSQLIEASYVMPYPDSGAENLLERLLVIHEQHRLDVIISTLDSELENYIAIAPKLKEHGIETLLPSQESFKMREKTLLVENIDKDIVPVPETLVLQDITALRQVADKMNFPLFIKGRFYEAYLARSIDEAVGFYHHIAGRWGLPIIVQEYIRGEECNVVALAQEGKVTAAVAMKKLYLTDKGKAWAGVTIKNDQVLEISQKLIAQLNWTGACELEFIVQDGKVYLLEMNPRLPAWVYLATRAGVNLPEAQVQLALGQKVTLTSDYQVGVVFVRHSWDEIVPLEAIDSLSTSAEIIHKEEKDEERT